MNWTKEEKIDWEVKYKTLFSKIKHGNEQHYHWLEKAIYNHAKGLPMPDYVSGNPSWTKEIPTVAGYYWIKRSDGDCHIDWVDEDGGIWGYKEDGVSYITKQEMLEFYGPLEEPK